MIIGGYIGQCFGLINNYYFTIIPFVIDFFVLLIIKVNKPQKDKVKNKKEKTKVNKLKGYITKDINGTKSNHKQTYLELTNPISLPSILNNPPPLLPGFIAASVWITLI